MAWRPILVPVAREQLDAIRDRRERELVVRRIRALEENPRQQGKPLTDELSGFYSVRAVRQRYRIIYQILVDRVIIAVVTLGIRREGDRKDMYNLARRLFHLGLLTSPDEEDDERKGEDGEDNE